MVARYYDNAIMKQVEDSLVYGQGVTEANCNGSTVVWNRIAPQKVYKKGVKRGKSKKTSSK